MASTRLLNNDDEYIDGLLDSSPAIIAIIYRRFSGKVKRLVTRLGGNMRDAARIFEEVLIDIYEYARHHQLTLTNRFENFFLYAGQLRWKQELTKRAPGVAAAFHPDSTGLDARHIGYVQQLLAEGEKRRYWLQRLHYLDAACQSDIRRTFYASASSNNGMSVMPASAPLSFPACIGKLITNSGAVPRLTAIDYERIHRFVITGMSESEREVFRKEMAASPALQANVTQYREAVEGLRMAVEPDNARSELESTIADQRQRWFHVRDNANVQIRNYVIIIAIIAAALAGLLFLSPWRKDVYRQFAPTEMVHAHRHDRSSDTSALLHEAAENFNRRRFGNTVALLNQVIARDSTNAYARYYRGISLVEMKQQAAARKDLLTVYNGNSAFRYDAAFYIALSYLQERDKQQCLEWLLKIPENAPNYWKASRLKEVLHSSR